MESLSTKAGTCCASIVLLAAACTSAPLQRVEVEEPAMGTLFRVVAYAPDAKAGEEAARAALERVHELDERLSDYREDSELSRLGAATDRGAPTGWIRLGDDLYELLACAQAIAEATDGAFDLTAGPVVALWRRARRQGELPDPERVETALEAVGWRKLELDPEARAAKLHAAGMRLDPGAIAKGFALDQAYEVLRGRGIERALVVGGGDVRAGIAPPGESGWRVAVDPFGDGRARVELRIESAAVSTSGDAFQALELGGIRYSHVLDPRTGQAVATRVAASVMADSAARADALATALCVVVGRDQAGAVDVLAWANEQNVEARVASENAASGEVATTPGFERLMLSKPAPPRTPAGSRP
jgi:FAD:protein FMN transferase